MVCIRTKKQIAHIADENTYLRDNDVASYYPRIILNQRLSPSHLGEAFLEVYESIVNDRPEAKAKTKAAKKAHDKAATELWATETGRAQNYDQREALESWVASIRLLRP